MNSKLLNLFFNFGLTIGSIIIALVGIEVLLQLIRPELQYQFMPQKMVADFFTEDEHAEFSLRKNYEGMHIATAAVFKGFVKTNSHGWRDNELDSRAKILVFGDSFTFGFGLSNGETIPDRLEMIDSGRIDYVNLGYAAGRSPDSYATYLRYHPELHGFPTIVILYNNDINDISQNTCLDKSGNTVSVADSNCFKVRSNFTIIRNNKLFHTTGNSDWLRRKVPVCILSLMKRSYLLSIARDKISSLRGRRANIEKVATNFSDINRKDFNTLLESILIIKQFAKGVVLVTFSGSEINSDIQAFAQKNNIGYISVPDLGKGTTWQRDGHFNALGASKAANIIHERLCHLNEQTLFNWPTMVQESSK